MYTLWGDVCLKIIEYSVGVSVFHRQRLHVTQVLARGIFRVPELPPYRFYIYQLCTYVPPCGMRYLQPRHLYICQQILRLELEKGLSCLCFQVTHMCTTSFVAVCAEYSIRMSSTVRVEAEIAMIKTSVSRGTCSPCDSNCRCMIFFFFFIL